MKEVKGLEEIREILARKKQIIMKSFGAVGIGIGKEQMQDDHYVIVVYLESAEAIPREAKLIEGVPIKFKVTGRIHLQSNSGGDS